MTKNKFIVGAYTASASLYGWNPTDETLFFKALRERKLIGGLEHGFYGTLHRYDDDWFLNNIDPLWNYSFTTIPGACGLMERDPLVGLASTHKEGQAEALEFIQAANHAVKKINHHLKRQAVLAVQVHSTPTAKANKEAFAESLAKICAWDWDGAKILVEHCDAIRTDGKHVKGFLTLEDDMWAARQINNQNPATPVGLSLNWARSVIETNSTDNIIKHIKLAREAKLLRGFIFSGTSLETTSPYFGDSHAPVPTPCDGKTLVPESIMTANEVKRCIAALDLDELDVFGLKIMSKPVPADSRKNLVYIDYLLKILAENN